MFSNAFNVPPVTVGAMAAASWTTVPAPGGASLVFDQCQVGPAYAPPGTTVIIKEHGKGPCVGSPSGHHLPGGFGWLTETGTWRALPDANGWVQSTPGNGKFPSHCTSTTDSRRAANDYSQDRFAIAYFPILDPGSVLLGLAVVVLAYFVPDLLIRSTAQKRRDAIRLELPNTLDQMLIAVQAGLGFEAAMARAAEKREGTPG